MDRQAVITKSTLLSLLIIRRFLLVVTNFMANPGYKKILNIQLIFALVTKEEWKKIRCPLTFSYDNKYTLDNGD